MKLYELLAEKAIRMSNFLGETDVILKNPTSIELMNWLTNRAQKKDKFDFSASELVHIKGLLEGNDIFIWNAFWASHPVAGDLLGLDETTWYQSYAFHVTYNTDSKEFKLDFHGKAPRKIRKQVSSLFNQ